jgi:hypothetical protein
MTPHFCRELYCLHPSDKCWELVRCRADHRRAIGAPARRRIKNTWKNPSNRRVSSVIETDPKKRSSLRAQANSFQMHLPAGSVITLVGVTQDQLNAVLTIGTLFKS